MDESTPGTSSSTFSLSFPEGWSTLVSADTINSTTTAGNTFLRADDYITYTGPAGFQALENAIREARLNFGDGIGAIEEETLPEDSIYRFNNRINLTKE